MDVQVAREQVWEAFNAHNNDDELDIHCSYKARTGSRMPQRVCRPQYAESATSRAGTDFARRLQFDCPRLDASCAEAALGNATSEAQAAYGRIPHMDRRLDDEMQRLARENPEVAAAILEYQAKEREYREAQRGD